MKKLFYLLVALIGVSVFFTSCSKDGTIQEGKIVGTWSLVKATATNENGHTESLSADYHESGAVYQKMVFRADGSCSYIDDLMEEPVQGTYSVSGDFIYEDGIPIYHILTLNNKKLVVELSSLMMSLINLVADILEEPTMKNVKLEYKRQ